MATVITQTEAGQQYLRPVDIARRLGLTKGRISQILKNPSPPLPVIRIGERTVLVRVEDFEAWLAARAAGGEQGA